MTPRPSSPSRASSICPIDIDGNGKIDPAESVYATRNDITKAIADGVYPSPPARDLYFVTKGKPAKPALRRVPEVGPDGRPEVRPGDRLHSR